MVKRAGLGAVAALAVLLAWWAFAERRVAEADLPREAPAVAVPRVQAPAVVADEVPADAPVVEAAEGPAVFRQRVDAVRASCDLDIRTHCDGAACAALSVGPDLDRLQGWVELVVDSPSFVLSTALRDLGVPAGVMPCGGAIAGLVQGGTVPAVELPDGTEVWCAGPAELCDAAARSLVGEEAARFTEPDVRQLRFAPG